MIVTFFFASPTQTFLTFIVINYLAQIRDSEKLTFTKKWRLRDPKNFTKLFAIPVFLKGPSKTPPFR